MAKKANNVDWKKINKQEGVWTVGYVPNIKNSHGRIASGVTIANGFDIGTHTAAEINRLNISESLKQKLYPFSGKHGADAVLALNAERQRALESARAREALKYDQPWGSIDRAPRPTPVGVIGNAYGPIREARKGEKPTQFIAPDDQFHGLRLSHAEAVQLQVAVKESYEKNLVTHFDKAQPKVPFAKLPSDVQTALMSLHYNTGGIWAPKHKGYGVFLAATKGDWADAVDSMRSIQCNSKEERARRVEEAKWIDGATPEVRKPDVGPKEQRLMDVLPRTA
ncbi:hypothetical protein JQ543_21490 [Bradyrhizobium diazoefficiens]|nr:pesticin C-terminus-like muramidase [Bradyrhizobium diazoefficiens]MBR0850332.1 hypothetical protein [Bradyrhizobium diazoefficiens]